MIRAHRPARLPTPPAYSTTDFYTAAHACYAAALPSLSPYRFSPLQTSTPVSSGSSWDSNSSSPAPPPFLSKPKPSATRSTRGAKATRRTMAFKARKLPSQQRRLSLDDAKPKTLARSLSVEEVLADGERGTVYLARHKSRIGALKVMRKQVLAEDSIDGDDVWRANNEVRLYRAIDKTIDGAQWITTPYSCFQDARNLYMFMEFAQGGNLRDLTGRYGRVLTSNEARFYVGEIAQGLGYIHSLGIIHGDLKLENVLIDGTGHVKLSDFSCAMTMDAIPELWHGTIEYTPPEIAKFRGYFDHTVDWYALGVLMFDLMAGHLPFWTANRSPEERVKLRRQVTKGLCSIRWPSHVQGQAKYLIRRLMRRDPRKRLGANCPFGVASLREPTEVLSHRFFDGVDWDTIQPPESYAWSFRSEDDTAAFYPGSDLPFEGFALDANKDEYGHLFTAYPTAVKN